MSYDVKQLAQQIAPHLGAEWTVKHEPVNEYREVLCLSHSSGYALKLSRPWNKQTMIEFTPQYWRNDQGNDCTTNDDYESINCTASRPPAAIAADIKRRLLTWYPKRYEERKAAALRKQTETDRKQSAMLEIAQRLGVEELSNDHWRHRGRPTAALRNLGSITQMYDERYECSLSLSHDEALLLADVMRSIQLMRANN